MESRAERAKVGGGRGFCFQI